MTDPPSLPRIARARGYRLYTESGRRLIDLYRGGGGAALGHRPDLLRQRLKGVLGRGLLQGLPSRYGERLLRALRAVFAPHRWFGVAATPAAAHRLLAARLAAAQLPAPADPLVDHRWAAAPVALWRPLAREQPTPGGGWLADGPPGLVHQVPFAVGAGPVTVSARGGGETARLAGADQLAPLLLVGAAHAFEQLLRTSLPQWPEQLRWGAHPGWRRSGIYLMAECGAPQYGAVVAAFLEAGVLLNPRYPGPSILPCAASEGEIALLVRLFSSIPGA